MSMRLIKAKDIIESNQNLGRLKSKSLTYQLDKDSALVQSIASCIASTSSIRRDRISGKLVIYLQDGGIMAADFIDTDHVKPSNNLPKETL